jgi:cyclopropane-fatty-acyl-phospholipid synthase
MSQATDSRQSARRGRKNAASAALSRHLAGLREASQREAELREAGQPGTGQHEADQDGASPHGTSPHGTGTAMLPASAGLPAVDPARWPDVAARPHGQVRATIARLLLARIAGRLPLRIKMPSGRSFGAGPPGAPELRLHRPRAFYRRVGAGGLIGFGESYMAGDWDCDDLTGLLTIMASAVETLVPPRLQWLRDFYVRHHPADEDATETGARRNIQRHYDLSNDLFALFLDESMTYSAALFPEDAAGLPVPPAGSPDVVAGALAAAQRRKIDHLLDLARVGRGSRVLEIGSGWGELAIRAAARGAQVLTVTISEEQRDLTARKIREAGQAERATVELLDYRRVTGQYDAIVSVEMIEAVAERYWPDYFAALDRLLAPGGRIALQSITMPHHRLLATRRTHTWILKYIFPGGLIPSVTAIRENLARTGLSMTSQRDFGDHYTQTLRIWRERFCAAAPELRKLGFDDVFFRMWLLYLSYSEAGFRSGYLNVSQFLLERPRSFS